MQMSTGATRGLLQDDCCVPAMSRARQIFQAATRGVCGWIQTVIHGECRFTLYNQGRRGQESFQSPISCSPHGDQSLSLVSGLELLLLSNTFESFGKDHSANRWGGVGWGGLHSSISATRKFMSKFHLSISFSLVLNTSKSLLRRDISAADAGASADAADTVCAVMGITTTVAIQR